MLRCHRITSALEVIKCWPALQAGLQVATKGKTDNINLFKALCVLATDESKGFVALVLNDKRMEGFCAMEDVTPLFATSHTFLCRAFYHQSGNAASTQFLMHFFESWARGRNISSYSVTTERQSGAAIRCFKSEQYGFKRSYVTFVKQLN